MLTWHVTSCSHANNDTPLRSNGHVAWCCHSARAYLTACLRRRSFSCVSQSSHTHLTDQIRFSLTGSRWIHSESKISPWPVLYVSCVFVLNVLEIMWLGKRSTLYFINWNTRKCMVEWKGSARISFLRDAKLLSNTPAWEKLDVQVFLLTSFITMPWFWRVSSLLYLKSIVNS